jgi:hypothetical protein
MLAVIWAHFCGSEMTEARADDITDTCTTSYNMTPFCAAVHCGSETVRIIRGVKNVPQSMAYVFSKEMQHHISLLRRSASLSGQGLLCTTVCRTASSISFGRLLVLHFVLKPFLLKPSGLKLFIKSHMEYPSTLLFGSTEPKAEKSLNSWYF